MEKYKIIDCLNKMTKSEYKMTVKILPGILGKSFNTFRNYMNIPITSKKDVPYTCVWGLFHMWPLLSRNLVLCPFEYVLPIKRPRTVNERRKRAGFDSTVQENASRLGVVYKSYTYKEIEQILNQK